MPIQKLTQQDIPGISFKCPITFGLVLASIIKGRPLHSIGFHCHYAAAIPGIASGKRETVTAAKLK